MITEKEVKIKMSTHETPEKITQLPPEGDINFDLVLEEKENEFSVSGWAAIKNQDATESEIFIVLRNDQLIYRFTTQPSLRPDVTASFKSKFKLDNSGYTAKVLNQNVERGRYEIGILIKDKKRNVELLKLTGKQLRIQ